ncbi:hypothetical protein MMC13_007619 [Lambiella insularis]|nr:hypothetical protein [Lambiella insularis]
MEFVSETPVKGRRTETWASRNDSGDEFLSDYETIDTVSLPKPSTTDLNRKMSPSPAPFVTQPTQIIDKDTQSPNTSTPKPSLLQVVASSPLRPTPAPNPVRKSGGILANAMAPPGTAFRPPTNVWKRPTSKPQVIDLSDDELSIRYRGGSSDEDSQRDRATIKPSTFIQRAQLAAKTSVQEKDSACSSLSKFNEITSKSFYKPLEASVAKRPASTLSGSIFDARNRDEGNTSSKIAPAKRSADVMANAYGSITRPQKKPRQIGPAKAIPVAEMSLDDIADYKVREKVRRMHTVLPAKTIRQFHDTLMMKKGNFDDAMEYLSREEERPIESPKETSVQIDLTGSDDEKSAWRPNLPPKPQAKQQLKAPNRTIHEKYATTQAQPRSTKIIVSSPPAIDKPRRKLMRGRKNVSSPIAASSSPRASAPISRQMTPESVDSDSGIGSEIEEDPVLEGTLLSFFNNCSTQDLSDIAAIPEKLATLVLSKRPFRSLDDVRQVSDEPSVKVATKKRSTKRPLGEKIVDTSQTMWTGYEAVDELVGRCEALGKPIADEMQKWGIDVFGASKTGELELANLGDLRLEVKGEHSSMHDSGIGTPTSAKSAVISGDEDGDTDLLKASDLRGKNRPTFFPQPKIIDSSVTLKDYQVVGINWLSLLFENRLSCILADDMGLGKTCQVIAFLASLYEKGVKGPHLIVVPGSTLENWLREFQIFCPTLSVMPYYESLKERPRIRDEILDSDELPNVIVTTYGIAKVQEDNKFLRRLKPCVCVFDEGHALKNSKSAVYNMLMKINAEFRLLLTGTPLQNNLRELTSLLGFILPAVFKEHSEDLESIFSHKAKTTDGDHSALLSAQRIARARSIMTPFILRRKKHQVLRHLPTKTRRVEYCELSPSQHSIYIAEQEKVRKTLEARAVGVKSGENSTNILMNLRKASIHPLLFRQIYDDKTLANMAKQAIKEEQYCESDVDLVYEDMTVMTDFELHGLCLLHPDHLGSFALDEEQWMDSGKVAKLCELLATFKENGDRVLVFSQFTMVMNILETVMETLGMAFYRLDGDTNINERQALIDQFYEEEDITVFMLSTKAGGQGINLACANKVVIFDSSFNPQEDIQAENRAHRVGQTRDVEVIRLVTRGTVEEQIHALGETKLALDDRVTGEGTEEAENKKVEKMGEKMVAEMVIGQMQEGEKP